MNVKCYSQTFLIDNTTCYNASDRYATAGLGSCKINSWLDSTSEFHFARNNIGKRTLTRRSFVKLITLHITLRALWLSHHGKYTRPLIRAWLFVIDHLILLKMKQTTGARHTNMFFAIYTAIIFPSGLHGQNKIKKIVSCDLISEVISRIKQDNKKVVWCVLS